MASLNKVTIIGRLGQDPEVRYTANGQAVANFTVATSENWTDKASGQKQEKTEWHKIVVWGGLAELCNNYLKKGRQVYLEGRIQTRSWDDKDGNKKYTTEIVANSIQFLDGNNNKTEDNGGITNIMSESQFAERHNKNKPIAAFQTLKQMNPNLSSEELIRLQNMRAEVSNEDMHQILYDEAKKIKQKEAPKVDISKSVETKKEMIEEAVIVEPKKEKPIKVEKPIEIPKPVEVAAPVITPPVEGKQETAVEKILREIREKNAKKEAK